MKVPDSRLLWLPLFLICAFFTRTLMLNAQTAPYYYAQHTDSNRVTCYDFFPPAAIQALAGPEENTLTPSDWLVYQVDEYGHSTRRIRVTGPAGGKVFTTGIAQLGAGRNAVCGSLFLGDTSKGDAFISVTDEFGNSVWARRYGTLPDYDVFSDIVFDSGTGACLVAGKHGSRALVISVDAGTGIMNWSTLIDGTASIRGKLTVMGNGNVAYTSAENSSHLFRVIILSPTGAVLHNVQFAIPISLPGAPTNMSPHSISNIGEKLFVAGAMDIDGKHGPFVSIFDTLGNHISTTLFDPGIGAYNTNPTDILPLNSGGYLLSGIYDHENSFMMKVDGTSLPVWCNIYPADTLLGMGVTLSGDYVCGGSSADWSGPPEIWGLTIRSDAAGTFGGGCITSAMMDTINISYTVTTIVDSVQHMDSSYVFTPTTEVLTPVGSLICGMISTDESSTSSFEIFPNPVHDLVHIRLTSGTSATVTIMNLQGVSMIEAAMREEVSLSLDGLGPGIYFAVIRQGDITGVQKIVVQ